MQPISPKELDVLLREGKAIPLDIRSSDEFNERHIPGAVMLPESAIDESLRMTAKGKEAVFYCSSGVRTKMAAPHIEKTGLRDSKFLEGGLNAWSSEGLQTAGQNKDNSGMSLQRQVQITVGIVLLIFAAASWSGASWSTFAVAAVGLGLTMAGLTGTCAMARVLAVMPWNRGKS
jgi:rhodanese-related sulfurtransferase